MSLALIALLLLAFAALWAVSHGAKSAKAPPANDAAPATVAAAPATPPKPEASPEPTPDARREEGGVIETHLPAAEALPKTTRKAAEIQVHDLTE
jgi:hypothetical protein